MHDIDRTLNIDNLEYDDDELDFEDGFDSEDDFEFDLIDDFEFDFEGNYDDPEEELAAELTEVSSDEELDEFIGDLVSKAWKKGKQAYNSKKGRFVRKHIAGLIRAGAKGGGAKIGEYVGDKAGGWLASKIEPEMELEVAKKLVRFTNDAAQMTKNTQNSREAKRAIQITAKKHIKPLLASSGSSRNTGRWVRRGNKIIVMT